MKIKIHFKGKDIPNMAFNRYAQNFAEVETATNDTRFISIVHSDGKMCAINLDLIATIEVEQA